MHDRQRGMPRNGQVTPVCECTLPGARGLSAAAAVSSLPALPDLFSSSAHSTGYITATSVATCGVHRKPACLALHQLHEGVKTFGVQGLQQAALTGLARLDLDTRHGRDCDSPRSVSLLASWAGVDSC